MNFHKKVLLLPFDSQCLWSVETQITGEEGKWILDYKINKPTDTQYIDQHIIWPSKKEGATSRKVGLWNETCLEAFFLFEDNTYEEWNFAPYGSWNCFDFIAYRSPAAQKEKDCSVPLINRVAEGHNHYKITIPKREKVKAYHLTSVLKIDLDGEEQTHFMAFQHDPEKPDFHNQKLFLPLGETTL
jgi:hypothetical protein